MPATIAALRHYRQSGVVSQLQDASPHRLIAMLYDGALERLGMASSGIVNGNMLDKLRGIDAAFAIFDHLRGVLDFKAGGDIAMRLDALYEYMMRRLLHAKLHNDAAAVKEVADLLRTIKAGWDAIAPSAG